MLTGPLFMLQVYDRVLASRSVPTLIVLFGFVVGLYVFLGLFELIRARVLSRIGYRLDIDLSEIANRSWIYSGLKQHADSRRPLNDLANVRQFIGSPGLPALFDLPWIPVYLAIVFFLHSWLGYLAAAGALFVLVVTVIGELVTRKPVAEGLYWELRDQNFAESSNRNAEPIIAMGMIGAVTQHWQQLRHKALSLSQRAGNRSETISALIKATRLLIQSSILALGAYLAILQEITAGTMIAASILAGRALAPIDSAAANWKNFLGTRQSFGRLKSSLAKVPDRMSPTSLPEPRGYLKVSNLMKLVRTPSAGNPKQVLVGLNFSLQPGDALGVIGPSASGKSSLAKMLVGLWMPDRGEVRFDHTTFDQWSREQIGRYIGYLPQSVEFTVGTIGQNISRFREDATDEETISAAKLAGVHELILELPNGYDTDLGSGEIVLSGGQAQRIALARAVFRNPPLIVLDEPNSNLDMEGDTALTKAIYSLREKGACVVVMAHRPSAIAAVNKVLVLKDGRQVEFGEKEPVLAKVVKQQSRQLKTGEGEPTSMPDQVKETGQQKAGG